MKNLQIQPFIKNCCLTEEKGLKGERGETRNENDCARGKWKLCTEQEVIAKVSQILYR
jgi:hypothetical protein